MWTIMLPPPVSACPTSPAGYLSYIYRVASHVYAVGFDWDRIDPDTGVGNPATVIRWDAGPWGLVAGTPPSDSEFAAGYASDSDAVAYTKQSTLYATIELWGFDGSTWSAIGLDDQGFGPQPGSVQRVAVASGEGATIEPPRTVLSISAGTAILLGFSDLHQPVSFNPELIWVDGAAADRWVAGAGWLTGEVQRGAYIAQTNVVYEPLGPPFYHLEASAGALYEPNDSAHLSFAVCVWRGPSVWGCGYRVDRLGVGARHPVPLVWQLGGGGWTHYDPPVPAGWDWVSCNSIRGLADDDLWVVGQQGHDGAHPDPAQCYAAHWDGSGWTVTPCPQWAGMALLADVVPISTSDVWAVGQACDQMLSIHWNGAAWSQAPIPPL